MQKILLHKINFLPECNLTNLRTLLHSSFSKLEIIPSSSFVLSNDIPVLMIHNDDYRLIRLDICLSSLHDSSFRPLSAISTAHTLFKGTYGHNQKEISEIIDFYGAYYDLSVEKDYTTFSFYFPKSQP